MTDYRVVIAAEPDLTYYHGTKPEGDIVSPRLSSVGELRAGLRPQNAETPNVTVTLDNADGALSDDIADYTLLRPATIYRDDIEVFAGTATRIVIGSDIRITVEA